MLARLHPALRDYGVALRAGVAQLARASAFQAEGRGFESRLPLRSIRSELARIAQLVEHLHGKEKVGGSTPPSGSEEIYFLRRLRI